MTEMLMLAVINGEKLEGMAAFGHGLTLMIVGMLIVFCSLALIGIMISILSNIIRAFSPVTPVESSPTPVRSGIPPHHLVAISAAAAVVCGVNAKVTDVKQVN